MANDCIEGMDNETKWANAVIIALLASLVFNPFFISVINAGFQSSGVKIASPGGCPNFAGLIIATIIFMFTVRLVFI